MTNRILSCAFLLAASLAANAEVLPKPRPFDSRITTAQYNPENVVRVRAQIGYVTLIQLEEGEKSNAQVGIGDSEAWGISSIDNNIFLKPTKFNPSTNLIITTNKGRTYSFKLVISKHPHYIVKMEHEKPKTGEDVATNAPCTQGPMNFNWNKWGHDAIAPSYMWDDGRFTCLKFDKNLEIPVVYQISPEGEQSLVNYSFKNDTMIIHSVSNEYRLRLGSQVVGLKSNSVIPSGYNKKATTLNATRGLKHD